MEWSGRSIAARSSCVSSRRQGFSDSSVCSRSHGQPFSGSLRRVIMSCSRSMPDMSDPENLEHRLGRSGIELADNLVRATEILVGDVWIEDGDRTHSRD